jgi:N-acetylglutamate synthase-like GNAT family acetyltransferase
MILLIFQGRWNNRRTGRRLMTEVGTYEITDDVKRMDIEKIVKLVQGSYWANTREEDVIRESVKNSTCFAALKNGKMVGFARVVSDYATMYYLCDVLVDEDERGHGIGKKLVETITEDDRFSNLRGMLLTKDAHGLYEKYGFKMEEGKLMRRIVCND